MVDDTYASDAAGEPADGRSFVSNPYSTGSGGGVLEARVATAYLADMLLGFVRSEAGGLPVVRVAFQTDPDPVDDLRVVGERDGRRVVAHVAARRRPNFVKSDEKTAKLVGDFLDQIDQFGDDDAFVVVAFAGMTNQLREVQELASMARDEVSKEAFHEKVHLPGRFKGLPGRYEHLIGLVRAARPDIATDDDARDVVWALLQKMWLRDFRVESTDETDWVDVGNRLNDLARDGKTGVDVRDALFSVGATQFAQKGSEVDAAVVRRKVHSVLAPGQGHSAAAWAQLGEDQKSALVAVQHSLAGTVQLPRKKLLGEVQAKLTEAGVGATAVVITGESGTGKSALTLSAAEGLSAASDEFEFVALNLRRTRETIAALSSDLGMPFADVLREMSATSRVLILDAADAVLEGRDALLRELAGAAAEADIGLALVTADTALEDVKSALTSVFSEPGELEIPGLDDDELRYVGSQVPAIAGALRNLPRKSLYRRFVVVDLLARTGATVSTTLDDWGCLEVIWRDLVDRTGPRKSSGEARTQALLALSEQALSLPADERLYARPDPDALQDLRDDRLVAPRNLMKVESDFGHDEIRRFATAVRLAQAESLTATLQASGPVRWAMSAAKLACEGKLARATDPNVELAAQVEKFDELGDESTVRWKDVPFEAALEMPNAFELLNDMVLAGPERSDEVLAMFIRVVSVHHRHDDMVDVARGEPVARLVVQEVNAPWDSESEAFVLLCEWLHSAVLESLPAGNPTRIELRTLLLEHWREHYTPKQERTDEVGDTERVFNVFEGYTNWRRPRRNLPWQITTERYVQLLALLGPDINDDVLTCLHAIAAESPSALQPAVDKSWCAWALALRDRHLLLELAETYYVDPGPGRGRRYNGVREHEFGRTLARGLSSWSYGPFWVMTRLCKPSDWVPVLNRILNHAAKVGCAEDNDPDSVNTNTTFTLKIDGTERTYVGDPSTWSWYRGNGNGPYPCMSALQAVERWFDDMAGAGIPLKTIVSNLLNGCENLAMVGLVVGSLVRHIDKEPDAFIPYLREPLVWQFDSIRVNHDAIGFGRADNDGITHPERRTWHVRDLAALLVVGADDERRTMLKEVGDELIANNRRFDAGESTVRGWASSLDATNMRTEPLDDRNVRITFEQPPDLEAEVAPMRVEFARYNELLGIQNKYWIPARSQTGDWMPPTPEHIAADLAAAKNFHENPPDMAGSDTPLVATYVAAAAVQAAADGHPEALGTNANFAINAVLGYHADSGGDPEDTLAYETDLGTRAAASGAVPLLLLPALAEHVQAAGATVDDVAAAASTLGPLAPVAACLQFARGCDTLWDHPCDGDPCIHTTAYQWVLDLARVAEIGDFEYELQRSPRVYIEGDVLARIPQIRPDHLDTPRLSATIRALGHASSTRACMADTADQDLATLLSAQASAMVTQETGEDGRYSIDDHGAQTISAARALLHNRTRAHARATPNNLLDDYLTTLAPDAHLLSAFVRDLAAVGSETQRLADAAAEAWPAVITLVLDQAEVHHSTYSTHDTSNDHALSRLLPNLEGTPDGLHHEFGRDTHSWVNAEEIAEFIPRWLPWAAGRSWCLLELIRFLRQLPVERQITDGLEWIAEVCISDPDNQIATYAPMDEWLVEIKVEAEARGAGAAWLNLVDRLVYAGNKTLASYSR